MYSDLNKLNTERDDKMVHGNIKWFGKKRRFGFVKSEGLLDIIVFYLPDSRGPEIIFEPGDCVSFDIIKRNKEPLAINVKKLT